MMRVMSLFDIVVVVWGEDVAVDWFFFGRDGDDVMSKMS